MNKLKKILSCSLGLVAMVGLASLTSCDVGGNDNNSYDFEVISFGTTTPTTTEEKGSVKIALDNAGGYYIQNVEINNTMYEQTISEDQNTTTIIINVNLQDGANQFELNSITYLKDINSNETETLTLDVGEYTTLIQKTKADTVEGEISVKSIEILKNGKTTSSINLGDQIQLKIVFNNPKNYKIVIVTINGKQYSTSVSNETASETTTTYVSPTITITNSNMTNYTINSVGYQKLSTSSKVTTQTISNQYANVALEQRHASPDTFDMTKTQSSEKTHSLGKNVVAVETNSAFRFRVDVTNPDDNDIKKIIIMVDGVEKQVNKFVYNRNSNLNPNIEFDLSFTSTGKHKVQLVGISDARADNGDDIVMLYEDKTDIWEVEVYDTIITTFDEFLTSVNQKLDGRFLLKNDIENESAAVTSTITGIFEGTLDGNGHKIDMGGKNVYVPLFNGIGTSGIVKNLEYTNFSVLTNDIFEGAFATTNMGVISNVRCSITRLTNTVSSSLNKTTAFVGTNDETGLIQDLELNVSYVLVNGTYNGLVNENKGSIQRVSSSIGRVAKNGADSDLVKINVFGYENSGNFSSCIAAFVNSSTTGAQCKNVDLGFEKETVRNDADGNPVTKECGNNYFVKDTLVSSNKDYSYYYLDSKTNSYVKNSNFTVDETDITYISNAEIINNASSFFSAMGFNDGEALWKFTGGAKLILKVRE